MRPRSRAAARGSVAADSSTTLCVANNAGSLARAAGDSTPHHATESDVRSGAVDGLGMASRRPIALTVIVGTKM